MIPALEPTGQGRYRLTGDVTFATVPGFSGFPERWGDSRQIEVDLAQTGITDTAALALVLDWLAAARASGRVLRIIHPPERLKDLVCINGLDPLFDGIFTP